MQVWDPVVTVLSWSLLAVVCASVSDTLALRIEPSGRMWWL